VKVAFTTSGDNLDAPLDSRFGRAPGFLVYDTQTGKFELIDNQQNLNAAQGAGIQAAQTIARAGAECLVTSHCGPKAFSVLSAAGIKVYNTDSSTIREALDKFTSGLLVASESADVAGHWV